MVKLIYSVWSILPQIIIGLTALILLLAGLFQGKKNSPLITYTGVLALLAACLATLAKPIQIDRFASSDFLVQNGFTDVMQVFVLLVTALVMLATHRQLEKDEMNRFEYPVLMMLAALGMIFMMAADDFMIFFVGLELQSLSIYILVALRKNRAIAGEAAIKYFILGVLATVFILYGISLIYGFTGSTAFYVIRDRLAGGMMAPIILAMVFILGGMAFKLSLAPFHMWAPDVYEGSPTTVTLFIASAPKVAAMVLFIRLLFGPLESYEEIWQPMLQMLSIFSMLVGVFGALFQTNIKRLLAFSTVANFGYMMIGVASVSIEGLQSVLVYLILYVIMTLGIFSFLLNLRRNGEMINTIDDLKGLSQVSPKMALAMAILMFSLAGIPPLAGFFAKLMIFIAAINAGLYTLVTVALLTTVVGAAYYLRIVKTMYFDEPVVSATDRPYDMGVSRETGGILIASAAINVFFVLAPSPLVSKAWEVATVLFER